MGALLWLGAVVLVGYWVLDTIYTDIRMSKGRCLVSATITDFQFDEADNENGSGGPFFNISYEFRLSSGEGVTGSDVMPYGPTPQIGDSVEVEYIRGDPTTNRFRNDGRMRSAVTLWAAFFVVTLSILASLLYLWRQTLIQLRRNSRNSDNLSRA